MGELDPAHLKACHCCGLVQHVPPLRRGERALCPRCGVTVQGARRAKRRARQTAAAALAALALFVPAITMPIMTVERFGHRSVASIWDGGVGMLAKGEVFIGLVVLGCSVVLPLAKLLGLLLISLRQHWLNERHRAWTYRLIEWTGRWGMLDILLIAVLVAWLKVGDLVQVTPGPAVLAFTCMVLLSLLASAWFDPHALWEETPQ